MTRSDRADETRRRLLLGLAVASAGFPLQRVRAAETVPAIEGARIVREGSDLAAAADAAPEGAVLQLEPGVYRASVEPKSGQTFIGSPGAVLDGGMSLTTAFHPTANNVTLRGLVVRNYANGRQQGAINADKRSGWQVLDCDVSGCRNLGVNLGPDMLIQGGRVHHNGYLGIGAGQAHGAKVIGVEIDHNGLLLEDPDHAAWEAGGVKLAVSHGCVLEENRVHDNGAIGLWMDIDCSQIICRNNLIWANADPGISYEISSDGLIEGNVVARNGTRDDGWFWSGQIQIYNSRNVVVRGNSVEIAADFGNGVTLIEHERVRADGFEYLTRGNVVEANEIVHLGENGISGVVTELDPSTTIRANSWRDNNWIVPTVGMQILDMSGSELSWEVARQDGFILGGRQMVEERSPRRL